MSQENLEVVLRYYAAWNQAGVRGVLPFWTPEFAWHDAPEMPDSSVYRGADAVLTLFQPRGRDRATAGRGPDLRGDQAPAGQAVPDSIVPQRLGSPGSRRAAEVGGVAGEHRDRAVGVRGLERGRPRRLDRAHG